MIFEPRPWQQPIIDHILLTERCAAWAGMGTGKTGATMSALQLVQDVEDPSPYLILAPKRVASYTWPREALKWDHVDGDTAVVLGSAAERAAALRGGLRSGNAARFTINYENLPWLVDFLADTRTPWPFRTIVADESTKLKSFRLRQGGVRAQALAKVAWDNVVRFVELTGTPTPNGLADLWGQAWFVDKGQRLGRSYSAYMNRWFAKDYTGFNWTPMDHAQGEIEDRLRDICLSISVPVEEPIVNKVYVELPAKVRTMYRQMERDAYIEVRSQGIEAVHAASKVGKLLQITSGAVYDEDGGWHELHDAYLQALESIVSEAAGMPVLVATYFKFDPIRIKRAFPQARVIDTDRDLDDWNAGKIPIGMAHPASLGHGVDMQDGGNILVHFGGDWNLEFHDQIGERLGPMRQKQAGHNRPVYNHYIMAEDTHDEVVFERRVGKASVQDAMRRALERRGL